MGKNAKEVEQLWVTLCKIKVKTDKLIELIIRYEGYLDDEFKKVSWVEERYIKFMYTYVLMYSLTFQGALKEWSNKKRSIK